MTDKIEHSVNKFSARVAGRLLQRVGDKGDDWSDVHPLWLIAKLAEELGEVATAVNHSFDGYGGLVPSSDLFLIEAITECYDIGAMAMILSEVLSDALAEES